MKKEILNRIQQLGGNIDNVKGISLQKDLEAITFNTVLYPKRKDTSWVKGSDSEPIHGIGDFIEENNNLLKSDKANFYNKVINHYYRETKESFGQSFYKNTLFTPFKEGSNDFEEWDGEWDESDFREVIIGEKMELMIIGYSYGFPDNLFVCLSDPISENPVVYGTDHEVYFDEITVQGTLEEYFNSFLSKDELIEILEKSDI
ncbi:hypothetical protein PG911_10235 [Tenacibaculum ovolyticum]|uniref:hypothetical protein n=1 Tax=Tenacibaculum ovolyticum TaxID=104270 RepID=UPI0022F3B57E|nr:hypothetical protein [Tenacibaculum ovolyticum]WBX75035.1 hypothetical protein PG911_10235 [Tenacibaculum ovolyticum]